MYSTYVTGF